MVVVLCAQKEIVWVSTWQSLHIHSFSECLMSTCNKPGIGATVIKKTDEPLCSQSGQAIRGNKQ